MRSEVGLLCITFCMLTVLCAHQMKKNKVMRKIMRKIVLKTADGDTGPFAALCDGTTLCRVSLFLALIGLATCTIQNQLRIALACFSHPCFAITLTRVATVPSVLTGNPVHHTRQGRC